MTRNEFIVKGFELMGHAVIAHRTNEGVYSAGACPNGSPSSWVLYVASASSWEDCYAKLVESQTDDEIDVAALLADGDAEQCPACGAVSAYAWGNVNYCPRADVDEGTPESERIYHVGACSCYEWTCGACDRSWTPEDSPLNSPCYTHSED